MCAFFIWLTLATFCKPLKGIKARVDEGSLKREGAGVDDRLLWHPHLHQVWKNEAIYTVDAAIFIAPF